MKVQKILAKELRVGDTIYFGSEAVPILDVTYKGRYWVVYWTAITISSVPRRLPHDSIIEIAER